MEDWTKNELAWINLGDERLHKRLGQMLEMKSNRPASSLPQACPGWAELIGAYRFFSNDKVTLDSVLAGHSAATQARMMEHEVVLCVQDTTFLNFGDCPQTEDLGPHTHGHEHGLSLHPLVAVSPSGRFLGTLWAKSWAKDPAQGGKKTYKRRPIEGKESYRWVEGLNAANRLPGKLPRRVVVADREADLYDLMSQRRSPGVHWLVRSMHNRRTSEQVSLMEKLAATESIGQMVLEVPRRPGVPARTAHLEIKTARLEIPVPSCSRSDCTSLEVSVIQAREGGENKNRLEWVLLTDLPVGTLEEAVEKLQWYRCRWKIEELFHVLKSGCQTESLQLGTRARLEAAIGVNLIVAWRLMNLKEDSRQNPDQDCSELLSTQEWSILAKLNKHPVTQPPTLDQAVRWIAKLGGYLNRKSDPPPGMKTLWRGWLRLHDIITGAALADTCV